MSRPTTNPNRTYLLAMIAGAVVWLTLVGVYLEAFPMAYLDYDYVGWRHADDLCHRTLSPPADILLLGDSRLEVGVDPLRLSRDAWSLAAAAATPIEGAFLLTEYLEHNPAPVRLVLSYSPHHLCRHETFWSNMQPYRILPYPRLVRAMRMARILDDNTLLPTDGPADAFFAADLRAAALRVGLGPHYLQILWNARLLGRLGDNRTRYELKGERHGFGRYGVEAQTTEPMFEVHHGRFRPSRVLHAHLLEILDLAGDHGIESVLLAMPMSQTSAEAVRPGYLQAFLQHLDELRRLYPTCTVQVGWPVLPDDHFGDPSHLNDLGTSANTAWVAQVLEQGQEARPAPPMRILTLSARPEVVEVREPH